VREDQPAVALVYILYAAKIPIGSGGLLELQIKRKALKKPI
jgi:hypothetical protein